MSKNITAKELCPNTDTKQGTQFTLYSSNCFQNQNNTHYSKPLLIKSINDLRHAVQYDHIFGKMENDYRSKDKWRESNCLYADIDNTHSENENEWITPTRFIDDFREYEFYLVASKSNDKEKDGKKARPKFHCYFPLGITITNSRHFEAYLLKLTEYYTYFDKAVKDVSRFFFGTDIHKDNYFDYYNNGKAIVSLLDTLSVKHTENNHTDTIQNGKRNTTLFSMARKLLNSGNSENEVMEQLEKYNTFQCETPLEQKELETIVNSAKHYITNTCFNNREKAIEFIQEKGFIRIVKNGDMKIIDTYAGSEYNQKTFITLHSTFLTMFDSISKNIGKWFVSLPIDDAELPVYTMVFNPSLPPGRNSGKIYNTFSGYAVEPDNKGDCSLIYKHLLEVWSNNNTAVYDYLLNWIAHLFQKPYEKPEIAIGIRSEEGTGKGIIIEKLLGAIIGEKHFVPTTDTSIINNRFNRELQNCLLFNLNEVGWIEKNQIGVLKSWITDKRTKIEGKGTNAEYTDTFFRIIFSTNCERIVETKAGQRRWIMLNPSSRYKGSNDYFRELSECIAKNKSKFLCDMLHRDISGFNPRVMPETEETKLQLELSKNSAEDFIEEVLNGFITIDYIPDTTTITKSKMYLYYKDYCYDNGVYQFSNKSFGSIIKSKYNTYFKEERTKNDRLWNITMMTDDR